MGSRPRDPGENGHRPPSGDRRSLLETVQDGNYRTSLEAIRDKLAGDLESMDPKVLPQATAQLRAVLKEIASLPDAKKVTTADELSRRRAERRAAARAAALASGEGL